MKCGQAAEPARAAAAAHLPTAAPCRRAAAEGPLSAERPVSPAEIKLICAGKFVDNSVALSSEWRCLPLLLGSSPAARPADRPLLAWPEPSPVPACSQHCSLCRLAARVWGRGVRHGGHHACGPAAAAGAKSSRWACCAVPAWVLLPLMRSLGWLHVPCTAGTACALPDGVRPASPLYPLAAPKKQPQEESKGCCVIC
jgi:hypothetical protein